MGQTAGAHIRRGSSGAAWTRLDRRRKRHHPVPAALVGRLAVSRDVQVQGIGRLLLADAVKRAMSAGATIGIHALVVDAKTERAKRFYECFGFHALPDRPERLFLPLGLPTQ